MIKITNVKQFRVTVVLLRLQMIWKQECICLLCSTYSPINQKIDQEITSTNPGDPIFSPAKGNERGKMIKITNVKQFRVTVVLLRLQMVWKHECIHVQFNPDSTVIFSNDKSHYVTTCHHPLQSWKPSCMFAVTQDNITDILHIRIIIET